MPLEQHAVPSQVTAYEFRLVGDMTLKQFGWLGGGIIIALLMYASPLPAYVRWPLILLFAPAGALIAFVPYEGRGLDRWILAFIRAAYMPTEFLWRQEKPIPEFFKKSTLPVPSTTTAKVASSDQTKLEEYIHTLPAMHAANLLDQQESTDIQRINQLLSIPNNANNQSNQASPDNQPAAFLSNLPTPPDADIPLTPDEPPPPPQEQSTSNVQTIPLPSDFEEPVSLPSDLTNTRDQFSSAFLAQNPISPPNLDLEVIQQQVANSLDLQPSSPPPAAPVTTPLSSAPPLAPTPIIEPSLQSSMAQTSLPSEPSLEPALPNIVPATFNSDLPLPNPPTAPNLLVGMITDAEGKIVDNAIIEIKDEHHQPVRALKTNKLGQFAIATPLKNGTYYLEVEGLNHQFDRIQFQATGEIIPPIAIQAKSPPELR